MCQQLEVYGDSLEAQGYCQRRHACWSLYCVLFFDLPPYLMCLSAWGRGVSCLEVLPITILNSKKKKRSSSKQEATIFGHGMKLGENKPPCTRCHLLFTHIREVTRVFDGSKRIHFMCFPLCHVSHCHFNKAHSRKPPPPPPPLFFFSSSPLPAHRLRHLVPCAGSSALLEHPLLHITWDEKISGGAEHSCEFCTKKKKRSITRILSRIFIFQYFLGSPRNPGADPWWWMIIIYSTKPDIYLTWLHLV